MFAGCGFSVSLGFLANLCGSKEDTPRWSATIFKEKATALPKTRFTVTSIPKFAAEETKVAAKKAIAFLSVPFLEKKKQAYKKRKKTVLKRDTDAEATLEAIYPFFSK